MHNYSHTKVIIREAAPSDFNDIMHINVQAFGTEDEVDLVAKLIKDPGAQPVLSMIATNKAKPVGHILFTKVRIEGSIDISTYLLAPMSVLPEFQGKGIGGNLIKEGLEVLRKMGVQIVFVLGHPSYYPRHGFISDAERHGFLPPYPILRKNANAWMFRSLTTELFENIQGKVICCDALDKPEYWRE